MTKRKHEYTSFSAHELWNGARYNEATADSQATATEAWPYYHNALNTAQKLHSQYEHEDDKNVVESQLIDRIKAKIKRIERAIELWNAALKVQDTAVSCDTKEACISEYEKALELAHSCYQYYEKPADKETVKEQLIDKFAAEIKNLKGQLIKEEVQQEKKDAPVLSGDKLWNLAIDAENAAKRNTSRENRLAHYLRAKGFARQSQQQYLKEAETAPDRDKEQIKHDNARAASRLFVEYQTIIQGDEKAKNLLTPIETNPSPTAVVGSSRFFSPTNINNLRTLEGFECLEACTFLHSGSPLEKLSQLYQRLVDIKQNVLRSLDTKPCYQDKKDALFELLQVSKDMTDKLIPWLKSLAVTDEVKALMMTVATEAMNTANGAQTAYTLASPKRVKVEKEQFTEQYKRACTMLDDLVVEFEPIQTLSEGAFCNTTCS